jgi:hypothetical protein
MENERLALDNTTHPTAWISCIYTPVSVDLQFLREWKFTFASCLHVTKPASVYSLDKYCKLPHVPVLFQMLVHIMSAFAHLSRDLSLYEMICALYFLGCDAAKVFGQSLRWPISLSSPLFHIYQTTRHHTQPWIRVGAACWRWTTETSSGVVRKVEVAG